MATYSTPRQNSMTAAFHCRTPFSRANPPPSGQNQQFYHQAECELSPLTSLALSSTSGGADINPNESNGDSNGVLKGRGLLAFVALLYGTLNVSLRLVYQLDVPPTAAALSATRGWLASACFFPLLIAANKNNSSADDSSSSISVSSENNDGKQSKIFMAGAELAVWNFLAQGLLNIGLLSTGSARASFLTQTSVILTPVISLIAGQSVASSVWIGCGLALCGLTLLSGGTGSALIAFSAGDLLVLGGALSWSLYLFRLSKIGSKFDEINLQAIKTVLLAVLYSLWLGFSMLRNPCESSWAWATSVTAWGALFYSALAPGMLADVLQQQGQKEVSASEANVILSMEPVFAAICAFLLLGEVSSMREIVGGGLILIAALIATREK